MRPVSFCALLVFTSCAFAQTTGATPAFEVATIKPAAPPVTSMGPGGGMRMAFRGGSQGGPGTPNPGQITYNGSTIKSLLVTAYGVKSYQISGPASIDTERYDIVAKVPQGASKDDVKLMLQNLLADRFKLTLHREKKDLAMYALVVAKNGPKLKESPPDDPNAKDAVNPADPAATDAARQKAMENAIRNMKDDGPLPPPPPGMGGRGGMRMMMTNGRAQMSASKQTMAQFAEWLVGQLDRPVVDQTGLTKNYDITLEYLPEGLAGRGPMGGMAPPPPPPGDGGAPAEPDTAPTLFAALQNQLGLKLEQKKGPVDLLVVDHLEKTPTEN